MYYHFKMIVQDDNSYHLKMIFPLLLASFLPIRMINDQLPKDINCHCDFPLSTSKHDVNNKAGLPSTINCQHYQYCNNLYQHVNHPYPRIRIIFPTSR